MADYGGPVGTLRREGSFSVALGRCNPALIPAHRSGRKLGPTPPTIKLEKDVEGIVDEEEFPPFA